MQTALVDRARRGDHEAFTVLAGGVVDRLCAIARLILRVTDLAEDATQEGLVRAWRDLPTLRDVESIEPAKPDRATELADRDQLERGLRRLSDAHHPTRGT